ncbi:MAG: FkbM family methyltransferase [Chitinispirillales bacterium]|jgi:FkbM family methyltransferase|nr:FkbM family methyltransferase [Chitinispirillales bacterium]
MTAKAFIKKVIKSLLPVGVFVYWSGYKSSCFFKKNRKRVEAVAKSFADERSREVYFGIIRARCGEGEFADFYTKQTQYFENEFFVYGDDEFLIDCGAFIGDTIDDFIKFVPNYRGVISFEASPRSFEILKNRYGDNPKIQLINKAVWSGIAEVNFTDSSDYDGAGNRIGIKGEQNVINVKTTSIDALELREKVTFIKMDIEGAEMEALKGAKNTILRDRPRLAICIYHSDEEMIAIAEWIRKLMPEYKLYVRHHWHNIWETTLYGVI